MRAVAVMLFALGTGLAGLGVGLHYGRVLVQAQWDAETARQTAAAVAEQSRLDGLAADTQSRVDAAGKRYAEALDDVEPGLADSVDADLAAGTLRVRYECAAPGADPVPAAAGDPGQADATAADADAQRRAAAFAAVRIGDAADRRENDLAAQVKALQAILRAERGEP